MLKRRPPRWLPPPRPPALSPPRSPPAPGEPSGAAGGGTVGPGCDGSAVTFFLVTVPRLALRRTFAMGPTAAVFLLLMLSTAEAKRTAGKTSSVLGSRQVWYCEWLGKGKN